MSIRTLFIYISLACAISLLSSCASSSVDPISPVSSKSEATDGSRYLWGLWDVQVIPDGAGSAQLEFTPLRSPQLHLNVVGIMEGGSKTAVKVDKPITLVDNILNATIRLTHPFAIPKFTGFDVRGILIGHGSIGGFSESMIYAGPTDMELLNADGHTRLWNPTQYSGSGYFDGKLGKPDAIANYTATLNGYKYFADGLTANMPVGNMVKANRGAFSAGASNTRHFTIRLGDKGLTFQYAVDANWSKPTEPVEVPGSFDVTKANCPEPYHIDARITPGIWGGGGSAGVTVDIYDWQKDIQTAYVEAPLLTGDVIELTSPQDFGDYVRFTGTLTNESLPAGDTADVLFYARGTDPVSSKVYSDYRLYHLPVLHVPTDGVIITVQDDMAYKTIGVEYTYGGADYDWSSGNPAPVDYNDTVGPWDFTAVPSDNSGIRTALAPTDPEVAGFAAQFDPVVTHFFKTQWILNGQTREIYQAEAHNAGANLLRLWGVYEEQDLQGAVPFDPPIDFPYPMNTSTHYSVKEKYTVIPFLLTFTIGFERWGIGQGIAFYPLSPGVNGWGWDVQPALVTRTIVSAETGGALGQGPLGKGVLYEWIGDNGTLVGSVGAGNSATGSPNFDEGTYQIIAAGSALALRSIQ